MTSRWLMMCAFAMLLGCSSESEGMAGDGGTAGRPVGDGGSGGVGGAGASESKDVWLCRPDIENDHCDTADLSTTEIHADGTRLEVDGPEVDPDATFDCFIVHSTGNDIQESGNVETISPPSQAVVRRILGQAARFRGSCRIFAPAYHMMTIGVYSEHPIAWDETEYFQVAYGDVADAFEYYMRGHNDGRDFVLIGVSQGGHMINRLLEEKFDGDPELREQLISALLVGMRSLTYVPIGEVVGGNFENIPLCSSRTETGCVIAFEPWASLDAKGQKFFIPPGAMEACVNPASLDNSSLQATMKAFWFSRTDGGESFPDDVATNWAYMPGLLASQCVGSRLVLSKVEADDPRAGADFPRSFAREDGNLHSFSHVAPMADLIDVIEEQASAR